MIQIGPYKLERVHYMLRDSKTHKTVRVKNQIYIIHESGEAMGCSVENERQLIAMLDEFWKKEF